MNRDDLLHRLEQWLRQEEIDFQIEAQEATIAFSMIGPCGEWHCRLICEERPALLQVICRLPLRVPEEKLPDTALLLHRLNSRLGIGSFALHARTRTVCLRLTMPVDGEAQSEPQIGRAVHMALTTFDDYFPLLCGFLADTPEARQRLARLMSERPQPPRGRLDRGCRPELN